MNLKRFFTTKRRKVYLISVAHLVHDIYTSFLSPVLPILIKNFTLTYTMAGFLRVAMRIPSLLNPLIGHFADGLGVKYLVVISPALTATVMSLLGVAHSYWSLLALLFVAGLSSSFFHVPSPVVLKRISGRRLGASMSTFQIGGELSRTIGPVIVVSAISFWGFEGIYRLMFGGIIMSAVLFFKLKDERIPGKKIMDLNFFKSMFITTRKGKALFTALAGMLLVKSFTASVLVAFLPTYLNFKGKSLFISGAALSVLQAAAMAGVLVTGTVSDKIGRKRLLLFLSALAPVLMFIFFRTSGTMAVVVVVLIGFFGFSSTPVVLALIQESNFEYPSVANGIYMMMSFILGSLIVLLFGKVSDAVGLQKAFNMSAVAAFSGLPFIIFMPEDKRRL